MCVFDREEMAEKILTTFPVVSITIGNERFQQCDSVEITESYIQFCVTISSSQHQVKILGNDIQTACFNVWHGRGNILLFIDQEASKRIFDALGLSRVYVDPKILAYWQFSSYRRILFEVNAIPRVVRDNIVNLSKDIEISFDGWDLVGEAEISWSNENREIKQEQPSTPDRIRDTDEEEPPESVEIVSTSGYIEVEQIERPLAMEIGATKEESEIEQEEPATLMEIIVTNAPIEVIQKEPATSTDTVPTNENSQANTEQASASTEKASCAPQKVECIYISRARASQKKSPDRPKIAIYAENLVCLEPKTDLNDNVVNAYLTYTLSIKQLQANMPVIHLLDSFFLQTVSRDIDMKQSYSVATNEYGLDKGLCREIAKKRERMIRKLKIFDADFLVLPICHASHWFLFIVCHLSRVKENSCKILIFDSVNNSEDYYKEHLNVLLHFIVGSYMLTEKHDDGDVERLMEYLLANFLIPDVPRQTNTTDCGLYVIEYVEKFFDNPDVHQDWSALINKNAMRCRRQKIKKILQTLV